MRWLVPLLLLLGTVWAQSSIEEDLEKELLTIISVLPEEEPRPEDGPEGPPGPPGPDMPEPRPDGPPGPRPDGPPGPPPEDLERPRPHRRFPFPPRDRCSKWSEWQKVNCWWPDQTLNTIPPYCKMVPTQQQWPDYLKKFVQSKVDESYNMLMDDFKRRGAPQKCGFCARSFECRIRNETEGAFCPMKEVRPIMEDCEDSQACVINEERGGCPPPLFLQKEETRRHLKDLLNRKQYKSFTEALLKLKAPQSQNNRRFKRQAPEMPPRGPPMNLMDTFMGPLGDMPRPESPRDSRPSFRPGQRGQRGPSSRTGMRPMEQRGGQRRFGPNRDFEPYAEGPSYDRPFRPTRPFGPRRDMRRPFNDMPWGPRFSWSPMDSGAFGPRRYRTPWEFDDDNFGPSSWGPRSDSFGPSWGPRPHRFGPDSWGPRPDRFGPDSWGPRPPFGPRPWGPGRRFGPRFGPGGRWGPKPWGPRGGMGPFGAMRRNMTEGPEEGDNMEKGREFLGELLHGTTCASVNHKCLCCCGHYIPNVDTGKCEDLTRMFPGIEQALETPDNGPEEQIIVAVPNGPMDGPPPKMDKMDKRARMGEKREKQQKPFYPAPPKMGKSPFLNEV